ncbi:unnamed protein product [Sphagnum tenellum]
MEQEGKEGSVANVEEPAVASVDFLDKSKFVRYLHRFALRIPKNLSHVVAKILSGYVLDMARVRHIVPDPSDDNLRLVIFSDLVTDIYLHGLPEEKQQALKKVVIADVVPYDVVLDYPYWPVEHILKEILPAGCEVPSSFETIGHIAHLNLREELLPYQKVIATVILDKNPKLKTVVNKVGTITNEFRVPEFEVLAGNASLVTEVKQHGATFRLDYGSVYWNSRLEAEHKRVFSQFQPGEVIVDMFAGIGPFAIPAAQQGCIVYANDLNPTSVKYLKMNSEINKVSGRVKAYNMDAREFIQTIMTPRLTDASSEEPVNDNIASTTAPVSSEEERITTGPSDSLTTKYESQISNAIKNGTGIVKSKNKMERVKDSADEIDSDMGLLHPGKNIQNGRNKKGRNFTTSVAKEKMNLEVKAWEHFDHVVMNLPASALEFLDVLNGLLTRDKWKGRLPRVHCYCFMRTKETSADVIERAEAYLKGPIQEPVVWTVRDVAPNKVMLCLSFELPEAVAFSSTSKDLIEDVATLKRPRTS